MASGSFEFGTSNQYIIGRCDWSQQSNGSSANTSNVSINVYFRRTNNYAVSYGTINTGVQCDSQSQWENNFSVSLSTGWVLTFARTFYNVPHNNDGSKTCYIRVCGNANFSLGNFDTNRNVGFDKIPRYTSITEWETTEIGQNYVKFRWATADNINFARVYLNDNRQHTDNPGIVSGKSGTFTYTGMNSSDASIPSVSTLKPGTSYDLKLEVRRADSNLWTTSSKYSFTTIPIATIINDSIDFIIGNNLTFNFQDYNNNKSFIALDIQKVDGTWEENVIKTDEIIQQESYTWNLSSYSSILYSKMITRNSANIRIRCGTTIDGTVYSNTILGEMKVDVLTSKPIFSDYTYGNTIVEINNVLGSVIHMPENYGNMQAQISVANKAIPKNQATILKYIATITNSDDSVILTKEVNYSDESQININFGSISMVDLYKINIYAVDSRGNKSSTISKPFTIIPYHIPYITIDLKRQNNYEENTLLNLKVVYSKMIVNGAIKNLIKSIKYRYVESGSIYGDTYASIPIPNHISQNTNDSLITYSNNTFVNLNDESKKTFNFEFIITDAIGAYTVTIPVDQGIPLMFIGDTGYVSVGKLPDWKNNSKFQVVTDISAEYNGKAWNILQSLSNSIIVSAIEPSPSDQIDGSIWFQEE